MAEPGLDPVFLAPQSEVFLLPFKHLCAISEYASLVDLQRLPSVVTPLCMCVCVYVCGLVYSS